MSFNKKNQEIQMNISKTAKAFAIAAVVGLTSQVFGASTNAWWSEDFSAPADIIALTNVSYSAVGQWSTAEGDESSIDTNGTKTLKLDTQGSNLTWTPSSASSSTVVLVDADIYLVGSDSEPTGFDPRSDVQTAVYLKNYIDESSTLTTNSVLCAYVEDNLNNNVWVELEGATMVDTNWYGLRIEVDYSGAKPVAKYYVDDVLMNERGASTISEFPIANNSSFIPSGGNGFVRSVSFRGTGAVDNFVGSQVVPDTASTLTFDVSTFTNNVEAADLIVDWSGSATVTPGTPYYVTFAENSGANYLTVVRVYTNGTLYVDYDANWTGSEWQLNPALELVTGEITGIKYAVNTTGLTEGYVIEAYYGADPAGGNPDPTIPPAIQPITGQPAVAFETIESVDYFAVSFVAPEAGIVYSLQTQTALGGSWTDETDPLATVTSSAANEEITLKAPTGGATTKFFRVKASTAP
jgi:hypothetical protein